MPPSFVMLRVRVTPRGGRDAVTGYRREDGVLLLRVAAPPVDGAANRAVLELVAKALGVKRGQVSLQSGDTGREKRIAVSGITETELAQRLSALPEA